MGRRKCPTIRYSSPLPDDRRRRRTGKMSSERREAQGMTLPVYLTAKQAADMLKVHERTVVRWAAQDASMPGTRISPRVIRFERERLLLWLKRKQPRSAQRSTQTQA